jgi:hypothetical protein
LNIASFGHVLMAFAMVTILGIVSQVDAAGGGPDQKADAMPADPATLATIKGAIALARKGQPAQAVAQSSLPRSQHVIGYLRVFLPAKWPKPASS